MVEDQGLSGGLPAVRVVGLKRNFGDVHALRGVDLDVAPGEFVSILGPSGCGKTTLLRIIGGFEFADEGRVLVDGKDLSGVPAHKRPVNTVFQRYALFPHKTVGDNVGFALWVARHRKADIAARVSEMLRLVRLEGFEDRSPAKLSGGQAQRVALARALINHPKVLLLDEPLAALDLKLRQAMHFELRRIQAAVGSTFIYVTHDQEEALTMSDRIVLMNSGQIEQIGSPVEVYRHPSTRFVSEFIGEVNLLAGEIAVVGDEKGETFEVGVQAGNTKITVPHRSAPVIGTRAWVSVRPEEMSIAPRELMLPARTNRIEGVLESSVFLGAFIRHLVRIADGQTVVVQSDADARSLAIRPDTAVAVDWPDDVGVLLCE